MARGKQRTKELSPVAPSRNLNLLWLAIVAVAALFAVFEIYRPSLGGPFVWDDREQPFFRPDLQIQPFYVWITGNRPLLMASYWLNYQIGGLEPKGYHVVNVLLHYATSVAVAFVLAKLLEWAGVRGARRAVLAIFGGALFMLHPLQTESVAYVTSRSEALSVPLYFTAYLAFLYRPPGPIGIWRGLAIAALAGAALTTKEHTLTLPALFLLTDLFWNPKKWKENTVMYGIMGGVGVLGGAYVISILATSKSAGFGLEGLSPLVYFLTQCRVIWRYVRLFLYPVGQNIDTDFVASQGLFDHGAVYGLIALIAVVASAVWFRKRWPLASFGALVFLLLIAPTSSFIPITDLVAERRMYLPFIGLVLVCLEFLRRLAAPYIVLISVPLFTICGALTYKRNQLWASPVALWQDTTMKSPKKVRPRFQMGYYYYNLGDCEIASQNFSIAAELGPPSAALLVNWGASQICAGRPKQALRILEDAAKLVPNFDLVHVYRGDAYVKLGDGVHAAEAYQRALAINPGSTLAKESLRRIEEKSRPR